jgi:hypothetical protein
MGIQRGLEAESGETAGFAAVGGVAGGGGDGLGGRRRPSRMNLRTSSTAATAVPRAILARPDGARRGVGGRVKREPTGADDVGGARAAEGGRRRDGVVQRETELARKVTARAGALVDGHQSAVLALAQDVLRPEPGLASGAAVQVQVEPALQR